MLNHFLKQTEEQNLYKNEKKGKANAAEAVGPFILERSVALHLRKLENKRTNTFRSIGFAFFLIFLLSNMLLYENFALLCNPDTISSCLPTQFF